MVNMHENTIKFTHILWIGIIDSGEIVIQMVYLKILRHEKLRLSEYNDRRNKHSRFNCIL